MKAMYYSVLRKTVKIFGNQKNISDLKIIDQIHQNDKLEVIHDLIDERCEAFTHAYLCPH